MANSSNEHEFIGTWDHFSDENFEAFLKEIGFGMIMRRIAKEIHPRLNITESNGKWTVRAETMLKTKSISFIPDVEYDDTTLDGCEAKSINQFKNGKWLQKLVDKNGKETTVTRFVDDDGLHEEILYGSTKAHRLFKKVN